MEVKKKKKSWVKSASGSKKKCLQMLLGKAIIHLLIFFPSALNSLCGDRREKP